MTQKTYRDLEVWQIGMQIVSIAYNLTREYPKDEEYGLKQQTRRAAVSIPSNIAEGYRRNSPKELVRFLRISQGSLAEVETQVSVAKQQSYITEKQEEELFELSNKEARKIQAFINSISVEDVISGI
ncbi:four helix bundle protein [PVC group bacterium]|nr:four helix bundle protein [PVC group bacterium]